MIKIFKEPLFWFAVIGVLLFAADGYFSKAPQKVVVDAAVKDRLGKLWNVQTGKDASESELSSIVENWVREEVFYREALRLGLDQGDSIVRRRLVQKLKFLVEEVPDDTGDAEALEAFYDNNIDRYSLPVRYSFSQIYFTEAGQAEKAIQDLARGESWRTLGESSLLSPQYVSRSAEELESTLGRLFVNQLFSLVQGRWVGPIRSSYGYHLVRLERILPGEATPLAYIERKVAADYQQSRAEAAIEAYYHTLLEEYEIVR